MKELVVAVEGDPGLVELGHQRPLLHRLQLNCRVEQVDDGKLARNGLLQNAGIKLGGSVDLDGLVGHGKRLFSVDVVNATTLQNRSGRFWIRFSTLTVQVGPGRQ